MKDIESRIAGAAVWLTRPIYADYEQADFAELPTDARRELDSYVQALRGYIDQFPEQRSPPREITEAAAPVFLKLANLINAHYPRPRPRTT